MKKTWYKPIITSLSINKTKSGKHVDYEHGNHRPFTPGPVS